MDFDTAVDFCEDHNAELPSISNDKQNDILASTSIHGFWIGYEKVSGEWKWLDGSTSNFSLLSKDKSGGKHVMVNKKGIWTLANEDSCAESICIIKDLEHSEMCPVAIPTGRRDNIKVERYVVSERNGKWQYCLFDVNVARMSWEDSKEYCYHKFQGRILSITSAREFIFLHSILYSQKLDGIHNVVVAPVERDFLRHLADANLTRKSVEYGELKFRIMHPKEGHMKGTYATHHGHSSKEYATSWLDLKGFLYIYAEALADVTAIGSRDN
ncbi:unnamed protein product [Enterobius vermicularis]|uniref:C-type lectin domain-containing protein n=1 Tax=Enterobius vermicularis TaxID=51028 RepID=A0A0N4VBG8_ENTVE|nr:unnamed protein product [Enterobius vermicularis]